MGIVPDEFDGMNLTENAAKLVFCTIDRYWFRLALSSEFVRSQFFDRVNQQAQPKLALKRIATSTLAMPPLPEQHRIVAKVDELMALCDQLADRLKAARERSGQYATAATRSALEAA